MPKTRTKIETPETINSFDDATAALIRISHLTAEVEAIDNKVDAEIAKLKEKAAKSGEPLRDEIKNIEAALVLFGENNKKDICKPPKRSTDLAVGTIGFRESTAVKVGKQTLPLLKKLFPKGTPAIRVKEEVNKEELKNWKPEELAKVDAAKKTKDTFYYEIIRDEVNQTILRQAG